MADLGNAYVNIVPKAPGISSNIEGLFNGPEASAGTQKAGLGIGKKLLTGLKLGAAAGAAGLVKIVKDSFEAGGKLEQSFGGLDTIYGEASAQAKEFAMQAAQAGISANTYAEQAVGMGAALKAAFGGDTAKAAEAANTAIMDMADNAAKMGTPIENLQNAYQGFAKGNYTMLDNLKLGYGGTQQEMQRLLTDAQKFSGVKYDINNLGDVYEAIHVIQGELGLTGVAASEASTTLQGSAGAMKASWENLMGALSTGEGMEQAMSNLQDSVKNFGSNVLRMLGNIGPQLPGLIKGLANTVMANAPSFIASGAELMVKLGVGVVQGIPKVIQKLPEVFRRAKSAFAGYDWKALGSEAIKGIAAGLSELASLIWEAMKDIARSGWNAFKQWITGHGGGGDGGSGGGGSGGGGGASTAGFTGTGIRGNSTYNPVASMPGARAMGTGGAAAGMSREDLQQLVAGIQFITQVVLEGDTDKLFKVVKTTNQVRTKATGINVLAARG